jgi:hypothetical protein
MNKKIACLVSIVGIGLVGCVNMLARHHNPPPGSSLPPCPPCPPPVNPPNPGPIFGDLPPSVPPTATDTCGPVTITQDADVIVPGNCPQNFDIRRTFHATDSCGNVITQTQVIEVRDTTAPVIGDLPAPSVLECPAVPVFATPTVTDADPNVVLTFVDTVTGTCPTVHVRTWSAVDCSGNVAVSKSQTISVDDNTPPVWSSFPANATVEFSPELLP